MKCSMLLAKLRRSKFLMKTISLYSIFVIAVFAIACTDAAKPPSVVQTPAPARPAAPQADSHDNHTDEDNAPRITLADAKKDFDNKTAVFIDTHSKEQYALEHIPGSINIQANTIKQNMDKVPKGKKLIAYCS